MKNVYLRSWWVLALRGILGIAFGVLALMWPGLTLLTLVALFAAYALIGGIASVVAAIRERKVDDDWWLPLLLGIVSIGAGFAALINPNLTALVLVLVIGANALVTGVLDMVAAIRLRKLVKGEWLLALNGIASMVFGALVFLYPAAGALAVVWLISIYALVSGVLLLTLSFRARRLLKGGPSEVAKERRFIPDRRTSPAH